MPLLSPSLIDLSLSMLHYLGRCLSVQLTYSQKCCIFACGLGHEFEWMRKDMMNPRQLLQYRRAPVHGLQQIRFLLIAPRYSTGCKVDVAVVTVVAHLTQPISKHNAFSLSVSLSLTPRMLHFVDSGTCLGTDGGASDEPSTGAQLLGYELLACNISCVYELP